MGPRLAPAGLGFITLFFGIGQAIGPALGGYLRDVTQTLSDMGVRVIEGELKSVDGEVGDWFLIEVKNTDQLTELRKQVMAVRGVTAVERVDEAPEDET